MQRVILSILASGWLALVPLTATLGAAGCGGDEDYGLEETQEEMEDEAEDAADEIEDEM